MTDPAFLDELERRIIAARVKFLGNAAARYRELRQLDEERWARQQAVKWAAMLVAVEEKTEGGIDA